VTLPPRALAVLATIRAELLSAPASACAVEPPAPDPPRVKAESKQVTARMRNRRRSESIWQRACRRRDWWTPTY
jgi:hypothetical protein